MTYLRLTDEKILFLFLVEFQEQRIGLQNVSLPLWQDYEMTIPNRRRKKTFFFSSQANKQAVTVMLHAVLKAVMACPILLPDSYKRQRCLSSCSLHYSSNHHLIWQILSPFQHYNFYMPYTCHNKACVSKNIKHTLIYTTLTFGIEHTLHCYIFSSCISSIWILHCPFLPLSVQKWGLLYVVQGRMLNRKGLEAS